MCMNDINKGDLGQILKQQRLSVSLTLHQLSSVSGVSGSHLGRIERGNRFPSSRTLRKVAKPLGLDEVELLRLGDYLSDGASTDTTFREDYHFIKALRGLDLRVASALAKEPLEMQHTLIRILRVLKNVPKSTTRE